MLKTVIETDFEELNLIKRGKVRDIYDLGDTLLMVATDRISAFDVVMPDPIPEKGKILTQISLFWFKVMESLLPNHVISSNVDNYPDICKPYAEILRGRSMLVKKAKPLPIECIVRGYISGSGWNDYLASGRICGIKLPENLKESDKLPEPIFTPSTKAETGLHDININFDQAIRKIGRDLADHVRTLSLEIYSKGAELAYSLFRRGHQVTVVDYQSAAFNNLPQDFRGRTIQGEALNKQVLHRAGIERTDGMAMVTSSAQVSTVWSTAIAVLNCFSICFIKAAVFLSRSTYL